MTLTISFQIGEWKILMLHMYMNLDKMSRIYKMEDKPVSQEGWRLKLIIEVRTI